MTSPDPDPQFGEGNTILPRRSPRAFSATFWGKVVAYLQSEPEVWHPLIDPPFKESSLRNIANAKNGGQPSRTLTTALSDPRIQVQFRNKVLYLRWTENP